jgi:NADH dehydrogenase [ubiquinone] 1 alpha subcomplex assembly factor 5
MDKENLLFDRKLLAARRSRHAASLAEHEFLLSQVADEIAARLGAILRDFPLVLDLGAYRGLLGETIGKLPSVGRVVYAESALTLAKLCPAPRLVCDEDLLPIGEASLDLVVSGLALHRVNDLPGALVQIRRVLKPDGLFMAALLGARSLIELREALLAAEAETHGGASPRISPFADVRDYGALLQRTGFALPVADADLLTLSYASPREVMREIRALGGGNVLLSRRKVPLTRTILSRAEDIYRERHATPDGKVKASFEIVYLSGWAPHEGQQKPLRPGSARSSLAEALGTEERSAGDKAAFPLRLRPAKGDSDDQ